MVTRPSVSLAFLSTPSARRATLAHNYESGLNGFLSTPSARRATYLLTVPPTSIKISIHALREEGDDVGVDDVVHIARFLSTPSARRATVAVVRVCFALEISIHALREEGDQGH